MQSIKNFFANHVKMIIFVVIVVIIAVVLIVRSADAKKTTTTYTLGTATTGTIVSTVSGTGQVSTTNTLAISPQVSGTLDSIAVNQGDAVKQGEVLFRIDPTNAEQSLEDAKTNLTSAQLDLETYEATNNNSDQNQSTSIADAYNSLLNSTPEADPTNENSSGYVAPTISGNYDLGQEGTITITTAASQGGISFFATGLVTGDGLINSASAQPIGNSGLYIKFPSGVTSGLSWTITIPNTAAPDYLSNYTAYQSALQTQDQATQTNGVNDLGLQEKQLAVTQAQDAVNEAETTLAEYTVTAPFDGVLASIPVTQGQQVSSGTTLGTIISSQDVAVIPLNEVDAANVAIGQKATMTFDAVPDLTITGKVIEVDTLGTVSQGVVNYNVKIAFDVSDPRIKSGMSVSASIATDVAQNVVMVPSSAIKSASDGSQYVLTATSPTDPSPVQVTVTTGISDDINTQITSGLTAGQTIVTKTTTSTASAKATTAAPSILGSIGGGGGTRGAGGGAR